MQQAPTSRRTFWHFLSLYQPLSLRCLHILIAFLIVGQILNSNGMELTATEQLASATIPRFFTLMHTSIGLTLLALSVVLIGYCLRRRGLRYFYPYLWGDIAQLQQDIHTLLKRQLPEANPKGLATSVQGLGLGALSLVVLSGASWFVLWQMGSPLASIVKDWHQTLTGLIEVYLIAHGGMGLLHFAVWYWQRRPRELF
ncbi:cytochrome b/b6 domain-containing protein [Serratia sp. JSRIV001]|nr:MULTISPECIES: cytochrome b/b6 domain-containing protein [unclassified Serratia (in: enterobacteria)]UAN45235.1 cytochrome b/b6 domain-containing protein [Serratia sp. JSRIV001]UAN50709.1 cytochrome b/b6 domain-containing protein [Serratia sp. JSRIV002]UAN56674.1 cytochrome b/b6 domain-containing protein [Serratia sp. JSRIV004]UAN62266.1 cytochrome b/b6 domain-containing protein [Serratia sp. JSRIV006]